MPSSKRCSLAPGPPSAVTTLLTWTGGSVTVALLLIQASFVIACWIDCSRMDLRFTPYFFLQVFLTCLSLFALGSLVTHLTAQLGFLACFARILFLLIYMLCAFYHFRSGSPFNYALLRENYSVGLRLESLEVIQSRFRTVDWIVCLSAYCGFWLLEFRRGSFSRTSLPPHGGWMLLATSVLYAGLALAPVRTFDEINQFVRSCWHYRVRIPREVLSRPAPRYPYLHNPERPVNPLSPSVPGPRPHIFIILIESFNRNSVERLAPNGLEYTPVFNALLRKGLFVERFYGNSVFTVKAQEALLFSIPPTITGCLTWDHSDLRLHGLPRVLNDIGYDTVFVHAYKDLSFHKTGELARRAGFDAVYAMDEPVTDTELLKHTWGWGLQDDQFYKTVFSLLDERSAKADDPSVADQAPVFVLLTTISSHSPFTSLPAEQRQLFPDPSRTEEHYGNTIHAVDFYLQEFFVQLKSRPRFAKSVVMIMGDHSHPMGEHGNFSTESRFYEENFQTPFLLLYEGYLAPARIRSPAYSQLDIAPTILDLLNITPRHHFVGRSILRHATAPEVAQLLVQPYDGRYLIAVKYPFKYVLHLAEHEEFLFDLRSDPQETSKLLPWNDLSTRRELRESASELFFNQMLINENRIWRIWPDG